MEKHSTQTVKYKLLKHGWQIIKDMRLLISLLLLVWSFAGIVSLNLATIRVLMIISVIGSFYYYLKRNAI